MPAIPSWLLEPLLGAHLARIKEYLRGTNPRIASAAAIAGTLTAVPSHAAASSP